MRPLSEQTILITGATDGLGRELAAQVAGRGATVLIHGRDRDRGKKALSEIGAAAGSEKILLHDLATGKAQSMAEIAAGNGRGPKPFILATTKHAPADATWNSNKGSAADPRAVRDRGSPFGPHRTVRGLGRTSDLATHVERRWR